VLLCRSKFLPGFGPVKAWNIIIQAAIMRPAQHTVGDLRYEAWVSPAWDPNDVCNGHDNAGQRLRCVPLAELSFGTW
jgi:hypothetical protein